MLVAGYGLCCLCLRRKLWRGWPRSPRLRKRASEVRKKSCLPWSCFAACFRLTSPGASYFSPILLRGFRSSRRGRFSVGPAARPNGDWIAVNASLFVEIELERESGRRAYVVDVVLVLENCDADPGLGGARSLLPVSLAVRAKSCHCLHLSKVRVRPSPCLSSVCDEGARSAIGPLRLLQSRRARCTGTGEVCGEPVNGRLRTIPRCRCSSS